VTQPKEQQEPSMEEILSSIRRIIADEASEEESERDAGGSLTEWPPERDADASALDAEDGDADDDVLELTEVVREDAEVIELDRNLAQPHPIEQQLEARPSKPLQAELAPGEQNRASASDEPAALRHSSSAAGGAPAEQPHGDHPAQSPTDIRDDEMEDHQTPMQKNGRESLVSDRAAGAATGAFAKLSQAVQRTPPEVAIADDSGRTVEQFIEDIMRPMLRDWLDENLPPLVERIVQKEIQKIVRRAEDS
jgi:cell pole-organizing protein PopZ